MPSAFFAFVQFLLNAMMLKSRKIGCFLPNFQRLRTEKKKKEKVARPKKNYKIMLYLPTRAGAYCPVKNV